MFRARSYLRGALLILAGLASGVLSLLGLGIFFWGVSLRHSPSKEVWTGVLLCLGPVLSAPAFLILFISPRWHMRLMWILACASLVMTLISSLIYYDRFSVHEVLAAIPILWQPVVIAPFLIAFLITVSHLLELSSIENR